MFFKKSLGINKTLILAILILLFLMIISIYPYVNLNSDVLYTFSFAKDILNGVPINNWQTPPSSYLFPDVLVSIFIGLFVSDPTVWWLMSLPIQILIFIFLYSFFLKAINRIQTIFYLTLSSVIMYLILIVLNGKNLRYMIEPFLVLGYHGFASIFSLILFLIVNNYKLFGIKKYFVYIIVFFISLSDIFFILYFGSFILANYIITKQRLGQNFIFFTISIITILLNKYYNQGFIEQILNSTSSFPINKQIIFMELVLILIFIIMAIIKRHDHFLNTLLIGTLFIIITISFLGLIKDVYGLRYLNIVFLVSVLIIYSYIKDFTKRQISLIFITSILVLFSMILYNQLVKKRYFYEKKYSTEIAFLSKHHNSVIVASYWPAKYIFEMTNRSNNLIQIGDNFKIRPWIYNKNWSHLHESNKICFIVSEELNPIFLDKLIQEHEYRYIDNNKLLQGSCDQLRIN